MTGPDMAGELARMGIDPAEFGIDSGPPETPPQRPADTGGRTVDQATLQLPVDEIAPPPASRKPASPAWTPPVSAPPAPPRHDRGRDPEPVRADAPVSPAEALRLLATPGRPSVRTPEGWRRTVWAVTAGLLTPGAAAVLTQERRLHTMARTRQTAPRQVAVLSGQGGAGCSTVAIGLAVALAALREQHTALVDARSGTLSLARRLAGRPAPDAVELASRDSRGEPAEPLTLSNGVTVVDGAPWHRPTSAGAITDLLAALGDTHEFTVLDAGNDTGAVVGEMLPQVDHLVVVTAAGADAVTATRNALGRAAGRVPDHPSRPGTLRHRVPAAKVTVAVRYRTRRQYRRAARLLRGELGLAAAYLVPVPHDPTLAGSDRLRVDQLRRETRAAYIQLAALTAAATAT